MNKNERDKRNKSIKDEYEKEMKEVYVPKKIQPGSAYVIEKLAKKHKVSIAAIYIILKSE